MVVKSRFRGRDAIYRDGEWVYADNGLSISDTRSCKHCNHYHGITPEQEIVDLGSGEFVADKKRIPLLKALNECGLITRSHCYGHKTGHSFVTILLDMDCQMEIVGVDELASSRKSNNGRMELRLSWKRSD